MGGLHSRGAPERQSGKDGTWIAKDMDGLSAFGLLAVTAMLAFYALEDHGPAFILAFAAACVLASSTGSRRAPGRSDWSKARGR
jgi:hypothetical protein